MRTSLFLGIPLLTIACASSHPINPQIAAGSVDFGNAAVQEVRMSNFDFDPDEIRLHAGRPYALRLINDSGRGHTFTAPEFFAAARIDAQDAARVAEGEVHLHGHDSAVVRLVPAAGTYKLVCTHFGHALLGMTGTITVM